MKSYQKWDFINTLMESKSIGSAQSPSRLEREFISPMRILSLAFPPDLGGEDMQSALDSFQKAMFRLGKSTRSPGGLEGPSKTEIDAALKQWEAGRVALNSFYDAMNKATESKRLVLIPAEGKGYPRAHLSQPSQTLNRVWKGLLRPACDLRVCPRPHPVRLPFLAGSQTLYTQLMKDAALCRNRGGEQLAGIWGQLMVYGTVPGVNPCGSVNMASYFQQ